MNAGLPPLYLQILKILKLQFILRDTDASKLTFQLFIDAEIYEFKNITLVALSAIEYLKNSHSDFHLTRFLVKTIHYIIQINCNLISFNSLHLNLILIISFEQSQYPTLFNERSFTTLQHCFFQFCFL